MTTAQRAAIARRPKIRRTARTLGAVLFYEDKARCRFVVYRRAGGVTRKTSVRYSYKNHPRRWAQIDALRISERLKSWPADNLATFKF